MLEQAAGDASQTEAVNADWESLGAVMQHSVSLTDTWRSVLSFQPDINLLVLAENLRFQLALVNELRGLLRQRVAAMETATKCRQLLETKRASAGGVKGRLIRCKNSIAKFRMTGLHLSKRKKFRNDRKGLFRSGWIALTRSRRSSCAT